MLAHTLSPANGSGLVRRDSYISGPSDHLCKDPKSSIIINDSRLQSHFLSFQNKCRFDDKGAQALAFHRSSLVFS